MSMLVPPQMLNTMVPSTDGPMPAAGPRLHRGVLRRPGPALHAARLLRPAHRLAVPPLATRDSLHEHDMWAAEGLTHRYPTKVLAEMLPTCPQYCGHCTRMDLVGNSTPQFDQAQAGRQAGRPLRRDARPTCGTPRRSVTSSSPVATWPTCRGRTSRRSSTGSSRSTTSATSGWRRRPSWGCPSTGCRGRRRGGRPGSPPRPRSRGVSLAIHTHVNNAQSVTPSVARAAKAMLEAGVRDVRNQGVLMRGVNDSTEQLLDLCFALHGRAP